ncbi:TonB-dependent receptor [Brucella sp. NM4]|uniref:TonB-dependent receptor n=1 Tax=Brucella/Ochrobactrum group TaxID=2826938 RepID=UPI0024BCFE9C|nr:TonB-dependent receptor [Brucella sp. NM4]WHS30520.1 TonB-dependent receptor [Brucella sp. NM4]WHT45136.1 TonB-dependent receptor [Ochrobactrum sp. SSR]
MEKTLRTALAIGSISLIAFVVARAPGVMAQEMDLKSHSSAFDFNIPSKPLLAALADFAEVTGIQIVRQDSNPIQGSSHAVSGRQSAETALTQMLSNSKLRHRFIDARTVSIFDRLGTIAPTDGTTLLETIVVGNARMTDAASVYSAPRSSVYVSGEELDRYGAISAADTLKGLPGIQVADSRNGGGVDVNIRGMQGQSRVAVTVDGSQQALNVYRGYAGTQQRSYFDPDLVSDMVITKGPALAPGAAGAIGGTVAITTLRPEDILSPGKNIGIRLKGELWDNGIKPPHRNTQIKSSKELFAQPHEGKENLFDSDARSGSAAFAFQQDNFDFIAAYARRNQGNYVAGRHGHDKYRIFSNSGYEQNSAATSYAPGEEVLNTSAKTESILLKATIRPTDEQELELSYRRFDGRFGEIMPSDIFRSGTAGIYQYPQGEMLINSASARYAFDPEDNDWINLEANLWWTDAQSSQINGVTGPKSQYFASDRSWVRMSNRRIGGDISNKTDFASRFGDFNLTLGGSFQHEEIQPQDGVVITEHDLNTNRFLRNGSRTEMSLSGQLQYRPVDTLEFWGGGRYSIFRSKDRNAMSKVRWEDAFGRWIYASNSKESGYMFWRPDANGLFSDATDPRLNNGLLFGDSNNPFDGVPFNEFGATYTHAFDPRWSETVVGFDRGPSLSTKDSGFTPAFGINYEIAPDTFLYASYAEGIRMPSLFETTLGTLQVEPTRGLKPERSRNWEIGASTTLHNLLTAGDTASFKIAYFNTNVKDYITRYYDPNTNGVMTFSNAESYKTSGLEFQSRFDNGKLFADLSATYYFKTETCDPTFASYLRETAGIYQHTENTPDCTPGSFMGSYTNTQNPPKYAVNLTLGSRFFEEKLILGGRMTYTSGPTEEITEPWQTGATTPQLVYQPVAIFDAFMSYKLRDDAILNASVQNITDRYYLDALAQSFMPAPGRTYRAGLTVKF